MLAQKIIHVPTLKGRCVDITDDVREFVRKTRVAFGIANVFVHHTTCALVIQENDRMLEADTERLLREITGQRVYFHPDNADSHLKSVLTGSSVTVPVTNNELALGTWQRILLWDFDRTSKRKVTITVIGEVLEKHEEERVSEKMKEKVL